MDILSKTAFKVPALPLEGEGIMEISFEAVKDGTTVVTTNSIPVEILASGTGGITLPRPTIENPDPYAQYVAIIEQARIEIAELNLVTIRRYLQKIGDGTNNIFTIEHNLGTLNVYVSVFSNSEPHSCVFCQVDRIDINTIDLSFSENPGIDEFTVLVMG